MDGRRGDARPLRAIPLQALARNEKRDHGATTLTPPASHQSHRATRCAATPAVPVPVVMLDQNDADLGAGPAARARCPTCAGAVEHSKRMGFIEKPRPAAKKTFARWGAPLFAMPPQSSMLFRTYNTWPRGAMPTHTAAPIAVVAGPRHRSAWASRRAAADAAGDGGPRLLRNPHASHGHFQR